tara:strand:+ start:313 stop:573 length:261 start_codon:yes stop_codon:yes gene_type:complete
MYIFLRKKSKFVKFLFTNVKKRFAIWKKYVIIAFMIDDYLRQIFQEFQDLNSIPEKIEFLQFIAKTGSVRNYRINLDATIKAWEQL